MKSDDVDGSPDQKFRIAGLTSLPNRLRQCWKEIDPTEFVEPDAMMRASTLLAEAAQALDEHEASAVKPIGTLQAGDTVLLRPRRELHMNHWQRLAEWVEKMEAAHGIRIIVVPYEMDVLAPPASQKESPEDDITIRLGDGAWTMTRAEWFALANKPEPQT